MKTLAIIPARGGSKGVKDKNIKPLDGKPLIGYAIESALESKLLTDSLVSTDSIKIAEIAASIGISVQIRPVELAQDKSSIVDVIDYVIHALEEKGKYYDILMLLQPTSPIRTGQDIDNVISMLKIDPKLDGVISVVPMDEIHPARMYELDSESKMIPLEKDGEILRRQDLKPVYYRNGCIYAIRTEVFKEQKSLMVPNKKAYVMSPDWLVNIDSESDLLFAELQVARWNKLRSKE